MQTIGTDGATPPGHALLVSYVDFWMDRFDSIGSAHARKLAALAACQLLTLPVPALLQRLDVLLPTISSVVVEVGGWCFACYNDCRWGAMPHTQHHSVHCHT